jgi:hypothetical protein
MPQTPHRNSSYQIYKAGAALVEGKYMVELKTLRSRV